MIGAASHGDIAVFAIDAAFRAEQWRHRAPGVMGRSGRIKPKVFGSPRKHQRHMIRRDFDLAVVEAHRCRTFSNRDQLIVRLDTRTARSVSAVLHLTEHDAARRDQSVNYRYVFGAYGS